MKLPDSLTVDSLEAAYKEWIPVRDPSLHLPTSLPNLLPFCVEAPLLQLIASASRKAGDKFAVFSKASSFDLG